MSRRAVEGGADLVDGQYLKSLIERANFETVDFGAAFARPGGDIAEIDQGLRTAPGCDLAVGILEERANVPTRTDRLPHLSTPSSKNASY